MILNRLSINWKKVLDEIVIKNWAPKWCPDAILCKSTDLNDHRRENRIRDFSSVANVTRVVA
jgi:hypothetical protein